MKEAAKAKTKLCHLGKAPVPPFSLHVNLDSEIVDPQPGSHQLAFGNLLMKVFTKFDVQLGEGRALTRADMFTQSTLAECGLLAEPEQVPIVSPRVSGHVTHLLRDLQAAREQCATLHNENQSLRAELLMSKDEVGRLKDQLVQHQLESNARVDR
ncbi:hypothetical protein H5410_004179, partial [Solanum commersonii]